MSKKQFPSDILEQAIDVQEAWNNIDAGLEYGTLTVGALAADINTLRGLDHSVSSLESQLTEIRNQREAICIAAWDKIKRVRAGVKATFGDDSSQYEMIGCKRLSDRKSPRRTPQPAQAPSA
jgi:hypothetical protein